MNVAAFDTETHLTQPGLLAPPLVCGSVATSEGATLLTAEETLKWYRANLGSTLIVGANIAYDNGVMLVTDPTLLDRIFDAYERGLFGDVQVREMLNHIGNGWVQKDFMTDPRTGGVLMDPSKGKKAGRMSLATVTYLCTGRKNAKSNADWRLKYARLRDVPMEQWPYEAVEYPKDDVRNTLEAWIVQKRGHINLHNEPAQLRAAWALQLASMWGLRTDPVAVDAIAKRVDAAMGAALRDYSEAGFRRADGTEDTRAVARRCVLAYGDKAPCEPCGGTGQVLHAVQPRRETTARRMATCQDCQGTGIQLVQAPLTDKGGIKCDRDTLLESGDELLEKYALVSADEKFQKTYLPYLRQGTRVPINPQANILLNTGRTSYDGLIQLIPRGGGLRETFVPRSGWCFCSIDYSALELSTLGQVTSWVVGWSNMADAINDGLDLHTKFAASMVGTSYAELKALIKAGDKKAKGYRQAAKAANFGFPGGMGAPKLVSAKRKEGLRFCIALGEAPPCDCGGQATCRRCHGRGFLCGLEMIREWNNRECPPVCKRCTELAAELRVNWLREWPEIKTYFKYITQETKATGRLEQFISKRIRGGVDFCNGANTLFQGLAADGAKHALWLVSKEVYTDRASPMFGARPIIFVHDEIFSEMPLAIAPEAADRMTKVMVDGMGEYVPDVRISAEPALMSRWYKEAECVRDAAGRLMVWEPKEKRV